MYDGGGGVYKSEADLVKQINEDIADEAREAAEGKAEREEAES